MNRRGAYLVFWILFTVLMLALLMHATTQLIWLWMFGALTGAVGFALSIDRMDR